MAYTTTEISFILINVTFFRVFGSVAEYFQFQHPLLWFVGKHYLHCNALYLIQQKVFFF